MKIYILDSKGISNPINIMESESISELKEQVKEKYKMNGNIELLYNGIILDDNSTLDELDIKDGMTINFLGQFKAGLNK